MGKQPGVRAIRGFCVACGSRNVVQHAAARGAADALVHCRSCTVISLDFNQRQQRDGVQPGFQPLDRDAALGAPPSTWPDASPRIG
jgi:hypothetical protein